MFSWNCCVDNFRHFELKKIGARWHENKLILFVMKIVIPVAAEQGGELYKNYGYVNSLTTRTTEEKQSRRLVGWPKWQRLILFLYPSI